MRAEKHRWHSHTTHACAQVKKKNGLGAKLSVEPLSLFFAGLVRTIRLAGKSPHIRSYTVYIYTVLANPVCLPPACVCEQ